eukprot:472862-Rhodomonas_salina.1
MQRVEGSQSGEAHQLLAQGAQRAVRALWQEKRLACGPRAGSSQNQAWRSASTRAWRSGYTRAWRSRCVGRASHTGRGPGDVAGASGPEAGDGAEEGALAGAA